MYNDILLLLFTCLGTIHVESNIESPSIRCVLLKSVGVMYGAFSGINDEVHNSDRNFAANYEVSFHLNYVYDLQNRKYVKTNNYTFNASRFLKFHIL